MALVDTPVADLGHVGVGRVCALERAAGEERRKEVRWVGVVLCPAEDAGLRAGARVRDRARSTCCRSSLRTIFSEARYPSRLSVATARLPRRARDRQRACPEDDFFSLCPAMRRRALGPGPGRAGPEAVAGLVACVRAVGSVARHPGGQDLTCDRRAVFRRAAEVTGDGLAPVDRVVERLSRQQVVEGRRRVLRKIAQVPAVGKMCTCAA